MTLMALSAMMSVCPEQGGHACSSYLSSHLKTYPSSCLYLLLNIVDIAMPLVFRRRCRYTPRCPTHCARRTPCQHLPHATTGQNKRRKQNAHGFGTGNKTLHCNSSGKTKRFRRRSRFVAFLKLWHARTHARTRAPAHAFSLPGSMCLPFTTTLLTSSIHPQ